MNPWVVIPTYNEADNIGNMAQALLKLPLENLKVLVVDDNSPDGTGKIVDDLKAATGRVDVLHRVGRRGLGTAYIEGFQKALDQGADIVIQMDADFSHSPDYLPKFIEKISNYDVIVGSRYIPGGKTDERWSIWRYLLSWWANFYTRMILGLKVHDATSGFKMFRKEALETINFNQVRSNGYIFQVEIAHLCEKHGLKILEFPIYFDDRRIGHSKMSMKVKVEAAWRVWEIRRRYARLSAKKVR